MANRFPLIFNSGAGQIQELAASDNLDLTSSNLVNAGILFTSSGSQTAPSLQIGSGTTYNPGLYSPGTDQVAVATNGSGRLFVNSNGRVGVMVTPSTTFFHVYTDAPGTVSAPTICLEGGFNGYGAGIDFASRTSAGGTLVSMAKITADGEAAWTTTASTQDANLRFFTAENGSLGERLRITSTGALNFVGAGTAGSTQAVSFNGSAPVNSLVIDSSGRLGIGNSSPSADGPLTLTNSTTTNPTIFFERESTNYNGAIQCSAFGTITFYNGADSSVVSGLTPRMTIDGQYGRVGIGTTNPGTALEVNGTVTATAFSGAVSLTDVASTATVSINNATPQRTIASISLTSGVWLITGTWTGVHSSGTGTVLTEQKFTLNTAQSFPDFPSAHPAYNHSIVSPTNQYVCAQSSLCFIATVSSTTTWYLYGGPDSISSTLACVLSGTIRAVKLS